MKVESEDVLDTNYPYIWCLHCEKVSTREAWVKNKWNCPVPGCDGGLWDAHNWALNDWPMGENPDYPIVPDVGKVYKLYGPNNLWDKEHGKLGGLGDK